MATRAYGNQSIGVLEYMRQVPTEAGQDAHVRGFPPKRRKSRGNNVEGRDLWVCLWQCMGMAVVRWGTEYATKDLLDRWLQVHGTDGFDKAEFEDVADEVLERLAVDPDSNLLIRADKASAPPGAEEFFRGSPHLLRLVTGAAMMQAEADAERDPEDEYDDGGFALTNRIAAQLMGRFTAAGPDQQTGRRGINILVKKGWLELITRGHPAISKDKSPTRQPVKGEPGRYRFANPTADEAKEVVPF